MVLKKPTRDHGEEDKISKLPDALIHHIYSFLPTKCVLSTCILSKRWKDFSYSAPNLDFSPWCEGVDGYAMDVPEIMNFVDTVLFVHEKPKIQKFVLSVYDGFDETRVNRWIRTVISRKVEELVLSIYGNEKPFIFPLSFFTCDSLIVLDLRYDNTLNLPNTISFPRLKILRLADTRFVNENSLGELFSNCPILEELSLVLCWFQDLKVLCITSRTLKHLTIRLNCCLLHSTLKISAPNLLTIKYTSEMAADFVLDSFPSLVEADIQIYNFPGKARTYAPLIKLYQKLSNVKLLKVSGSSFGGLSAANILLADLPIFYNLVHLELCRPFRANLHPDASSSSSMRIFLWFLQLLPNLESILFSEGVKGDLRDYNWIVNSLPQHFLSNLKSVVIPDFTGCKVELDVVKFFLANAGVLQMMTITTCRRLSDDYKKQKQIASELLKFPRSSPRIHRSVSTQSNGVLGQNSAGSDVIRPVSPQYCFHHPNCRRQFSVDMPQQQYLYLKKVAGKNITTATNSKSHPPQPSS